VQDIIKKGIGQIIDKIKTPATAELLEAEKETVERRFQASASKGLKALRELDSKVFHVPPHVLHPEHMFVENQYTSEEEEQKTARLEELKAKYREVTCRTNGNNLVCLISIIIMRKLCFILCFNNAKSHQFQNMAMLAHLKIEEEKYAAMEDLIQKEIEMQDRVQRSCSSLNITKLKQFWNQVPLQIKKEAD